MEHDAQNVLISTLKPFKGNARTHDIPMIRASLRKNGQFRPVVVRTATREILAGNGTMVAALEEGWEHLWATFIDVDEETAKRIVLADNRTNDVAGYDDDALLGLLGSLEDLEGTGFSDRDLERLQEDFETGDQEIEDEIPARFGVVIELSSEEEQAAVMEAVVELGFEPRALYS